LYPFLIFFHVCYVPHLSHIPWLNHYNNCS
jgi:hypothetical protein